MKNLRPTQLCKVIVFGLDEFEQIVRTVMPGTNVHCSLDGLSYSNPDMLDVDEDELRTKLANYFDIAEISSIHADDCETPGIWLVYNET